MRGAPTANAASFTPSFRLAELVPEFFTVYIVRLHHGFGDLTRKQVFQCRLAFSAAKSPRAGSRHSSHDVGHSRPSACSTIIALVKAILRPLPRDVEGLSAVLRDQAAGKLPRSCVSIHDTQTPVEPERVPREMGRPTVAQSRWQEPKAGDLAFRFILQRASGGGRDDGGEGKDVSPRSTASRCAKGGRTTGP